MPRKSAGLGGGAGILAATLLIVTASAAACSSGGGGDEGSSSTEAEPETTISLPEAQPPTTIEDGSFLVAQASDEEIPVYDEAGDPEDPGDPAVALDAADETSGILTFLVEERRADGWLKVQLPTAPMGSSGFILERETVLTRHRYSIEISRSAHTMVVNAAGVTAYTEQVAIGPDAPPAGTSTFIKEVLLPPEGSPYNARSYVYGLAGAPNSEQDFADGVRVVALHVVADPATLGKDALTGSFGVKNDVLARLYEDIGLPLGTPVEIVD
jgi:hypothetical protein